MIILELSFKRKLFEVSRAELRIASLSKSEVFRAGEKRKGCLPTSFYDNIFFKHKGRL
ncbi:hypothetical protein L6252_01710 [Candidatus Parcubacteria bacterium]|nr:hypothetical protein [Candidatus Parcubacteria bacterium]